MNPDLVFASDTVLATVTSSEPAIPGVAAVATDRERNLYAGAAGATTVDGDTHFTTATPCVMSFAADIVTTTLCLQLVEDGTLDLDAPARGYLPELEDVWVLDGTGGEERPQKPRRDITTRMLLLHTSGLGLDIFKRNTSQRPPDQGDRAPQSSEEPRTGIPLLFEPGEEWQYSEGLECAGQIVESIVGMPLWQIVTKRILKPLRMNNSGFREAKPARQYRVHVHQRQDDGSLRLMAEDELALVTHGAGNLISTADDFAKFVRMWLDDGMGPDGPVLAPETIDMASQNGLGRLKARRLDTARPQLANDVEFFPDISKSWALASMINDQDTNTGRPAGGLAWAGLTNVYYWIDRKTSVGGVWATQVLPFADLTSFYGFIHFERAIYENLR